jgi:Trypsin-like peptidase domain
VVFLGRLDEGKPQPCATGFFVSINNILHLVTAKHVVVDPENESPTDAGMLVFYNGKDGRIRWRSIDDLKGSNITWLFHEKREVDIGILPFKYEPTNDDIQAVPDNFFFSDQLYEVYDVFFLSCQPGVEIQQRVPPIIRGGTISLINENNTFLIDGSSFPGNSGSPVFLKPSALTYTDQSISIGGDQKGGKFVGVIGAYIPYHEYAISEQTREIRVLFTQNTGLSLVWSVSLIKDIINSDKFKGQINRIKPSQDISSSHS